MIKIDVSRGIIDMQTGKPDSTEARFSEMI